ncbi:MAG: hypothetical protein MI741_01680, partial [Rhodospirillales bacterium]|nr:hypothetical protein [Rhodospirillales bacterium]
MANAKLIASARAVTARNLTKGGRARPRKGMRSAREPVFQAARFRHDIQTPILAVEHHPSGLEQFPARVCEARHGSAIR